MKKSTTTLQTFRTTEEKSQACRYDHLARVEQELEDRELIARYVKRNR